MRILVLNTGSSSVKFAVLDTATGENLASGLVENIGGAHGRLKAKHGDKKIEKQLGHTDHLTALTAADEALNELGVSAHGYDGVGHRIVSGGEKFTDSMLATVEVIQGIEVLDQIRQGDKIQKIEVVTE